MDETILICGLTRCGSSLTMQMLDKGGLPVIGDYPGYEPEQANPFNITQEYITNNAGKIIKLIDPQHAYKRGIRFNNCRVVYLSRNKIQQAKSVIKFACTLMGIKPDYTPATVYKMMLSLSVDEEKIFKAFRKNQKLLYTFEALLEDPVSYLSALEVFLNMDIDIRQALTVPVARNSDNYDGFLELSLLEASHNKTQKKETA